MGAKKIAEKETVVYSNLLPSPPQPEWDNDKRNRDIKNVHGHPPPSDKKILTSPSTRICPLLDELKKGDFFTPLPSVWTNVS